MQLWDDDVNLSEEAREINHLIEHRITAVAKFPFQSLGCVRLWINCFPYYWLQILGLLTIGFVGGVIVCGKTTNTLSILFL